VIGNSILLVPLTCFHFTCESIMSQDMESKMARSWISRRAFGASYLRLLTQVWEYSILPPLPPYLSDLALKIVTALPYCLHLMQVSIHLKGMINLNSACYTFRWNDMDSMTRSIYANVWVL
jgi:hypothetical protein